MKAEMSKEGKITIRPSDEIEAYALTKWSKDNTQKDIEVKTSTEKEKMGFAKKEQKND